jgi:hypothetical protein
MTKIFIVAPAKEVTGGPELLHQLADALNREGQRAWMLYTPFRRQHEIPTAYQRYNVAPASLKDVEPDSIVIMPEISTPLIGKLPTPSIYFWWLSVDNFFDRAGYTFLGRLIGRKLNSRVQIRKVRRHVVRHLYQSEYAREFLDSHSLGPTSRLSDYLADEYVQGIMNPPPTTREDLVVYNPRKGARRAKKILRALRKTDQPLPDVVPIKGMTRSQVCDLLGRAKVYIDFGGHPGKDRIPREAVALGACVLVNRRGSASNSVDVPIPDDFKVDDRQPGYAMTAAARIQMLMSDFERHAPRFEGYRQKIAAEPAEFVADAQSVFPIHP